MNKTETIKSLEDSIRQEVVDNGMENWPIEEDKIVNFEELIGPVKDALLKAYRCNRTKLKSIPYDGYTTGFDTQATCPSPVEMLKEESLNNHKEQGRNALDVILMIAFQLGHEQGRRSQRKEWGIYKRAFASDWMEND